MKLFGVLGVLVLLASCIFWGGLQQEQHDHAAPLKLGEVSFLVSCKPGIQTDFDEGVALLHSFAYSAAEKKFREIAAADPACAMAHWGVAMSFYHQLWEPAITLVDLTEHGKNQIQKAQELGGGSPREQGFIDAIAVFYQGSKSDADNKSSRARALDYENVMARVAKENPNDVEAQIFYALALLSSASSADRSHVNQKLAAAILEPLYVRYPQHPGIAHYLIHAYDNPEMARQGLPAARAYALIAPSAPHALHMPSHIFTQLGLWQDSIKSNLAARAAAHAAGDIGEELHAMDYLMYAYLQAGRYREAAQLLGELGAMRGLPESVFKVGYAATAMPVRFVVERHEWAKAATTPQPTGISPQVEAIIQWAHAIGLARSGKPEAATPNMARLAEILLQVRGKIDDYWTAQVEIEIEEAKAWVAHAKGENDEAISLLRAAATREESLAKSPVTPGPIVPAREQLGDLLMELKRPGEALREFEAALVYAPRRRNEMMGAYVTAKITGDLPKAEKYRSEMIQDQPGGGRDQR